MIIAFVPARGGSKSIPLKNIKNLCGKPLIYYVLNSLNSVTQIKHVFVATDSNEIKQTVDLFNFRKVTLYDRDPKNAQDMSSTESVMIEFIQKQNFDSNDIFILAQATSPFTRSTDIEEALRIYQNSNTDSLLSCVRITNFFWNEDGTPINYDYNRRPRRQDYKGVLMENGAFYISTVGNILKYQNRLSGKIKVYEMPQYSKFEIDEPNDWIVCEQLMKMYIINSI